MSPQNRHYKNKFNADRWILVPFVQESYGRVGSAAVRFVRILASHSAACRGGNNEVIKLVVVAASSSSLAPARQRCCRRGGLKMA
jgi:hypothetical protein